MVILLLATTLLITACSSNVDDSNVDENVQLSPRIQCRDGLDNDGDTYIDLQDSKCVNSKDRDESPRDFCNDSDGINYLIQGTASGEDNSIPFSNTDFCVSSTIVREYGCLGRSSDYNVVSNDINCAVNITSSCIEGRCA